MTATLWWHFFPPSEILPEIFSFSAQPSAVETLGSTQVDVPEMNICYVEQLLRRAQDSSVCPDLGDLLVRPNAPLPAAGGHQDGDQDTGCLWRYGNRIERLARPSRGVLPDLPPTNPPPRLWLSPGRQSPLEALFSTLVPFSYLEVLKVGSVSTWWPGDLHQQLLGRDVSAVV